MDFAKKQLQKYGWTEGKGLGKNENGISEALKPKLKRSVTGVGYDVASDFTEHWWTQLYDKAARNVEVEDKNGKTKKLKTKESEDFEITNNTWHLSKKKSSKEGIYSKNFVKKSTLTNGVDKVETKSESDSADEIEKKDVFQMTDEELFAACEGRTAHKGARHGLKALGKLARIAQQEQLLLTQPQFKGYSHAENLKGAAVTDLVVEDINLNSDVEMPVRKKKKKRKCRISQNSTCDVAESNGTYLFEASEEKLHSVASNDKNKNRKKKKSANYKEDIEDVNEIQDTNEQSMKPKKKKRCKRSSMVTDLEEVTKEGKGFEVCDSGSVNKRKKKKHKNFD